MRTSDKLLVAFFIILIILRALLIGVDSAGLKFVLDVAFFGTLAYTVIKALLQE